MIKLIITVPAGPAVYRYEHGTIYAYTVLHTYSTTAIYDNFVVKLVSSFEKRGNIIIYILRLFSHCSSLNETSRSE